MLLTRVLSALILGPLLLFMVYKGGIYLLFLTFILVELALRELFAMSPGLGSRAWKVFGYLGALFLILGAYLEQGRYLLPLFILWLILCLSYFVIRFPEEGINDLSFNYLAVGYITLLFAHLILLRGLEQGVYLTFLAFALTWATDTGAYFTGRTLGKHKMAPKVSPNKTVEGAVGGLIFAAAIGSAIGYLVPNASLSPQVLALFGLAVGITGQLGDLVESAIKRFAGVKDSGSIIPGHGGILDRFDSVLFTFPTVYYLFIGLIIS